MKVLSSLVAVSSVLTLLSCRTTNDAMIEALLKEAKSKFAPDRRTMVFDVHGKLDGSSLVLTGEIHNQETKEHLLAFLKDRGQQSLIDSLVVLPRPEVADKPYGVVSVSVANLRVKPGHEEEMATQVLLGTPLRILKKEKGWYLVQGPDDYLGWTDDMVEMVDREGYESWLDKPKVIVTSPFATAYGRGGEEDIVGDLVTGNILAYVATIRNSVEVEYPDGRIAYVNATAVQKYNVWLFGARDTPDSIAKTAKRFMGVPYLWGGTSSKGMDCSGFTKMVFYLNGILLPRDAGQQALVGEPVDISSGWQDLTMGDLLFFGRKTTAERPERVTHVGIYLSNGRFIHESGDVRLNSLDPSADDYSEYRAKSLLSVRRIIGKGAEQGVRRLATLPEYRSSL